jgi:hypothetical protein
LIETHGTFAGFLFGTRDCMTPEGWKGAEFELRRTDPAACPVDGPAFFKVVQKVDAGPLGVTGTAICAGSLASTTSTGSASGYGTSEPFLSFHTVEGTERARVDAQGFGAPVVTCGTLNASAYLNLAQDHRTHDGNVPASAAALASAFVVLSNQIVSHSSSYPVSPNPSPSPNPNPSPSHGDPIDSFKSTSTTEPPTANALRNAFSILSNMVVANSGQMSSAIPRLVSKAAGTVLTRVRDSVEGAVSNLTSNVPGPVTVWEDHQGGGAWSGTDWADCWNVASGPLSWGDVVRSSSLCDDSDYGGIAHVIVSHDTSNANQIACLPGKDALVFNFEVGNVLEDGLRLDNDVWLASTGDNVGRFFVEKNGTFKFGAPGNAIEDYAGDPSSKVCFAWYLHDRATHVMEVNARGDLSASGTVSAAEDVWAGRAVRMGDQVVFTHSGCNVGLNLDVGQVPVATFHVKGSMYSEEVMFSLSDRSVKTDVVPLERALERLLSIRGCSYARTDLPPSAPRQVGVIAQEVERVLPEAVNLGPDGKMSVAYGNLLALAIEAIRELHVSLSEIISCR